MAKVLLGQEKIAVISWQMFIIGASSETSRIARCAATNGDLFMLRRELQLLAEELSHGSECRLGPGFVVGAQYQRFFRTQGLFRI